MNYIFVVFFHDSVDRADITSLADDNLLGHFNVVVRIVLDVVDCCYSIHHLAVGWTETAAAGDASSVIWSSTCEFRSNCESGSWVI